MKYLPKKTTKKSTKKVSAKTENKKIESKTKMVTRSPINHFEIPYENLERIKTFYSSVFGWELIDMPEMDYTLVYTTAVDRKHNSTTPGAVNGGFTKRNPVQAQPTLVITIKDIKETIKEIKNNNCELLGDVMPVENMGLYQLFKDPEGNVLGVFQPLQM